VAPHMRSSFLAFFVLSGCFNTSPVTPSDAASDATADWLYCSGLEDCVLRTAGCCDVCGKPTAQDVDAVRVGMSSEADHRGDVCPMPPASCPLCATSPNPALYPLCITSQCLVFDVRAQPLSACNITADCALVPHDCCGCGGGYASVRNDAVAAFHATVCDPDATCMACGTPPVGIEAFCAPDGHCDVRPIP
jgi:hypothetical protein